MLLLALVEQIAHEQSSLLSKRHSLQVAVSQELAVGQVVEEGMSASLHHKPVTSVWWLAQLLKLAFVVGQVDQTLVVGIGKCMDGGDMEIDC